MTAKKKTAVRKPTFDHDDALFGRVATILEQSRANAVRAVKSHMMLACWLIGREIVQEIQGGGERAAYGKQVLDALSRRLTQRFRPRFSETSLKYFQTFYLAYGNRRPLGDHLIIEDQSLEKSRPLGADLTIRHPPGDESLSGFSLQLTRLQGFLPELGEPCLRRLREVTPF